MASLNDNQVRHDRPFVLFAEANQLFGSQASFGVTISGEYSNGINDCGFYLKGVEPYTPANPDCALWNDWENWDQATKDGLLNFALASMDALENPFFWTWKVRESRIFLAVECFNRFSDWKYAEWVDRGSSLVI